jgi:hypothetical protein
VTERNSPPVQCPDSAISLAGFQVSTYGRFWVSPEDNFRDYVKPIRRWYRKHETENPYKLIDVAPDGKRFVVLALPEAASAEKGSVHVMMLLNFFDELKRRIP